MQSHGHARIGTGKALWLALALMGPAPAFALDPGALPTGGQVIAGQAAISQTGGTMTLTQQSDRLIANWNSFNIGRDASVTFRQPGASSVVLNRILDQNPSQIYGSLTANGQVFLINPAGVYFGPTARVDVGGLVASSLNVTNEDFLSGRYSFDRVGPAGGILNQGSVRAADGGYVAFLSPRITNEGTITAQGGTVAMAAGDKVSLDFTGDRLVNWTVEQGAVEALIENRGLIRGDGGTVILTAKAADSLTSAVVNNSGVIEAKTLQNEAGRILLLADMASGETVVGGTLDASAPSGGDGGFIETSAARVTIRDDFRVTTRAPLGRTGAWLIDPRDFTIAASGGDMTGAQATAALAATDLEIQSASGGTGAQGDLFVNDSITWAANTLTLNAYRNIEINRELFGSGTARLALLYGQGAADGVIGGTAATYGVKAPINLPAGNSYSTRLGSGGALKAYTVITSLGAAGSTTKTDLQGMQGDTSLHYALGANIDASATGGWNGGAGFQPVGDDVAAFTGTFDGLGHTITGLTINRPIAVYTGLFGLIEVGAGVYNVGMVGGSIQGEDNVGSLAGSSAGTVSNSYNTGSVTGINCVGGLLGCNDGTLIGSYSTGTVAGTGDLIGGLVGTNAGTIRGSHATGLVTGRDGVGGLVGINNMGAVITGSYATGHVTGSGDYVGGLVGLSDGTVTDSHATGDAAGRSNVGGLVGYFAIDTITNSYATGAATGTGDGVGGLVGYNDQGVITGSHATGTATGRNYVAGLVGYSVSGSVVNSHATGTVTGADNVGGLIGLDDQGAITGSYATGGITGSGDYAGGLAGFSNGAVTDSHATGTVTVSGSRNNVGGLVGFSDGTIARSYASGAVIAAASQYVGGLVGYKQGGAITDSHATGAVTGNYPVGGLVGFNSGTITSGYATGAVTGSANAGGLVGYSDSAAITNSFATGSVTAPTTGSAVGGLVGTSIADTITNSYATGAATGGNNVGGLVGYSGSTTITRSYATGAVTGSGSDVGGLVGVSIGGTVTDGFWDTQTSGRASSAGGTGKTTAEMKRLATFGSWDIDDAAGTGKVWRIYDGYTYPLLRSFMILATATVRVNPVAKAYDGTTMVLGGSLDWSPAVDSGRIYGTPHYSADGKDLGTHAVTLSGLYSSQLGYDIRLVRGVLTIKTPYETSSVTSRQRTINGTQQGDDKTLLGPGSGSPTLAGLAASSLVSERIVLFSRTFSIPATLTADDQTITLEAGGTEPPRPLADAGILPVFTKIGNAPASLLGNFQLRENATAISLAQTTQAGQGEAPRVAGTGPGASVSFSVRLENGTSLQLTVSVGGEGALIVTVPGSAGMVEARQAILMGARIARQELNVDLRDLKSALFVQE